jgi:hypothetical protein
MHLKNFLILALVGLSLVNGEDACDFCRANVATISNSLPHSSREEILDNMKSWCVSLENWSGAKVTAECKGFVSVYAGYLIDMVSSSTSGSSADEICTTLGVCSANGPSEFSILFPVVYDDNVTYAVEAEGAKTFMYKIFVGNATELFGSESTSLTFKVGSSEDLTMKISNDKGIKDVLNCHSSDPETCTFVIFYPGSGQWYYIELSAAQNTHIVFNVTEKEYVTPMNVYITSRRHGLSLISFLLLVSTFGAVLCLCISCCLRLKNGKFQRSRACKKVEMQVQQPEMMGPHTSIQMDMLPQQSEMNFPLIGYYYYPEQDVWSPAYGEYQPQPPQPFPQAPPHTDE